MCLTRSLIIVAIVIASFGSVCAQRRWERLPPPRDPQFYEARNKLEDFDGRVHGAAVRVENRRAREVGAVRGDLAEDV